MSREPSAKRSGHAGAAAGHTAAGHTGGHPGGARPGRTADNKRDGERTPSFTLRAPLLAFERVHRRTGTIRKTCTFHNPGDQKLPVRVRYGFREHSWFQVVPERPTPAPDPGEPDLLSLPPGESRVHLLIDTDSSNFPFDRFRGRVHFEELDTQASRWIEVSFEEIEELLDFEGHAAIDLGTSNSIVALYHLQDDAVDGEPWNPVLEQSGDPQVPSAVFLRDLGQFRKLAPGSCSVGRAAVAEYRRDPGHDPRSLQLGVKRMIGQSRILTVDAHGAGGYVDPSLVLQVLARALRERSQNHPRVQSRLRRLMVTYPPTWDYRQITRWKSVFQKLGFTDQDLDLTLDEASAAGLFHVFRWMKDPDARNRLLQDLVATQEPRSGEERYLLRLLSFDFGGGTIDLALIAVEVEVPDDAIRLRITLQGSDSLGYGGDHVTLAVFRILKRRLAMAVADPQRAVSGRPNADEPDPDAQAATGVDDAGRFLLPRSGRARRQQSAGTSEEAAHQIRSRWDELERHLTDERLPGGLDDAVDGLLPTRFWTSVDEPIRQGAKHAFGWLWDRAERIKRDLFRAANRPERDLPLRPDADDALRADLPLAEVPGEVLGRPAAGLGMADARAWVTVGEIHRCIAPALERAVASARRLAGRDAVDRVVLTGQSSWIPLVRRLFMRPRSEGGFGLAPNKIEFDAENAKAAVAKGACLLRILRDNLVGIDVDVSGFRANLLAEIFYRSTVGGPRILFEPGPVDDLRYLEESPDPRTFARQLTLFQGSPPHILGHFDFAAAGDELPSFAEAASEAAAALELDALPSHEDYLAMPDPAPERRALREALHEWPEAQLIAWMEASASPGTPEQPVHRYYLTRNRNLLAVRDRGTDKRLFTLRADPRAGGHVSPREDPFSGIH